MKLATAKEMQQIDSITIKEFGIPGPVLMERAGLAVASHIAEDFSEASSILVMAGTGNNGGDGVMVARELINRGYRTSVLIAGKKDKLSRDCKAQVNAALAFGVPVRYGYTPRIEESHDALIVDALIGTGLKSQVKGSLKRSIEFINNSGRPVVSVDIPSGICANTGQVLGTAVMADMTITFGAMKRGHMLYPGASHSGDVHVHDIGFPIELISSIVCNVLEDEHMRMLLPERYPDSHKGDYGHLLIIAGSEGKTGAAMLASSAALRTGAGLVTLAAPESLKEIYQNRVTEAMVKVMPSTGSGAFALTALDEILEFAASSATAIAIGPGIGQHAETVKLVRELIKLSPVPIILDADGINALGADAIDILNTSSTPVTITPHPGEMARICGMSVPEIQADRVKCALEFAARSGTYIALKGAPTIIAGPEGELFINPTGGPALAKGGTGDALTGMVAAMAAMQMSPLECLLAGTYMHGLAGDLAAMELGDTSVLASDLIDLIPQAFEYIEGDDN